MAMPSELVIVRHGESDGNIAVKLSKNGDDSLIGDETFQATHSSRWQLTDRGREQATITGEWLREQFPEGFDRYYTSEYARAMQTAALLGFQDAEWIVSPYLRERWWGDLDRPPYGERKETFLRSLGDREQAPYYWRPPNGESLVEVCDRIRPILDAMHRECDGARVLIVCHGEVMEAFRVELERINERRFLEIQHTDDGKILNCQVDHFTRRVSDSSDELAPYLVRRRSAVPSRGIDDPPWRQIIRRKFSNEDLLALASE